MSSPLNFAGRYSEERAMENIKQLKRGTSLCVEGENITHLQIIKSGKVSFFTERAGQKIELKTVSNSGSIGGAAMLGEAKHLFSAEAVTETHVIEIPIDMVRTQMAGASPLAKVVFKNLLDDLKYFQTAYRSNKMEQDKSPCPPILIPRIFTILQVVARITGQKDAEKANAYLVDFGTLKIQTSRLFLESPPRIRSLLDLLAKLKHIDLIFDKNEEGEEELAKIQMHNVQLLEDFAEFYQYNLFKGGKSEVIEIDKLAVRVAKALIAVTQEAPIDRRGAVRMNYETVVSEIKTRFRLDLKDTHLNILEKKGLFVKRQAAENVVYLSFDKAEFDKTVTYWDIINEIDMWNEKGSVNLTQKPISAESTEPESTKAICPSCSEPIAVEGKFCSNCGHKLAA